jgi:hypothetical protein
MGQFGFFTPRPMKNRSKIELLVVITMLVAKAWSLQQQFSADGAISVVVFGTIALAATIALLCRSTGLAFVLAVGSTFSAFTLAREYCFAPSHSFLSVVLFTRDEAVYVILAACLFSLWAEWRFAQTRESVKC